MLRLICSICHVGKHSDCLEEAEIRSNVRNWKKSFFKVWRCSSCGSINSLKKVNLQRFYRDYPFSKRKLDFITRIVYFFWLKEMRQHGLSQQAMILDFGGGSGVFYDYLGKRGYANVSCYDSYSSRFSDKDVLAESYDVVTAWDVIEHLESLSVFFDYLASMLKPNGLLCISTPRAEEIDLSRPDNYLHTLHQPYHISIYSQKSLVEIAKKNGYEVEKVYHRHFSDTAVPFVNWRFFYNYLLNGDNTIDVAFERPKVIKLIQNSLKLIWWGFFGRIFRMHGDYVIFFRKTDWSKK